MDPQRCTGRLRTRRSTKHSAVKHGHISHVLSTDATIVNRLFKYMQVLKTDGTTSNYSILNFECKKVDSDDMRMLEFHLRNVGA